MGEDGGDGEGGEDGGDGEDGEDGGEERLKSLLRTKRTTEVVTTNEEND
jgi:hypothetical protein